MRKPNFCLCKIKTQISYAATVQMISTFSFATQTAQFVHFLNLKFQASILFFFETVQVGLCQTWSETPKTGFLASQLRFPYNTKHLLFTLQTRDDFLGLVEIPLSHTQINTEAQGRDIVAKDYILRPRRWVR